MNQMNHIYGKNVLQALAEIYPQLYLDPRSAESAEAYKEVVQSGKTPEKRSLSHFLTDEKDSFVIEETPVGDIGIVTLFQRQDFETFLRVMAYRCTPREIPSAQGASMIGGIANWNKINRHKDEYLRTETAQGRLPDWSAEFERFTSDRSNYTDALIVLSVGPYSGVPAERLGYGEEEWLALSREIRKAHECTHFICRKKYPQLKEAIWDEVVADAVGIVAALGKFDLSMEEVFLGIDENGYTGGRLKIYAQENELDDIAKKIHRLLLKIGELSESRHCADPYAFAVLLEEKYKNGELSL